MDKKSEKVLNYLCAEKEYKEFFYGIANMTNDVGEISIRLEMSPEECKAAIDFLETIGYVLFKCDSAGNITSFQLTHIGMNYKVFKRIETIDFVKKSIIVPIAVAFITAILTTGALWLLGWK